MNDTTKEIHIEDNSVIYYVSLGSIPAENITTRSGSVLMDEKYCGNILMCCKEYSVTDVNNDEIYLSGDQTVVLEDDEDFVYDGILRNGWRIDIKTLNAWDPFSHPFYWSPFILIGAHGGD